MEYFIYCDESEERGPLFSNFYGGALVRSIHYHEVVDKLLEYKEVNGLKGELKWTKVTAPYLEKYKGFIDVFFDLIKQDKIKMRVMFQQNEKTDDIIRRMDKDRREGGYFKLYYQFFKHAFGLKYSNQSGEPIYIKAFFDQFPDTKEKVRDFKGYIYNLQYGEDFLKAKLKIRYEDIVEATSHDYVILQGVDIVTGAMYFRLNKLHKVIEEGKTRRGKRTVTKEKLYEHINKRICEIYPRFNIGVSTGMKGDPANKWNHPYRHWSFIPNEK